VSPIDHVDTGTPAILPMHGPEDAVGPIKQSRAIEERLKAAGKDVRFGC
jgi:dipeptidyl aminopeptidase/acylaminoacyl peptidase